MLVTLYRGVRNQDIHVYIESRPTMTQEIPSFVIQLKMMIMHMMIIFYSL